MSVPSSSPYKSRLLTFLNRQSLRLKTRVGRSLRQVRTAAEWGIQILLYPAYLLIQIVRLAEHRLKQLFIPREWLLAAADSHQTKLELPAERLLKSLEQASESFGQTTPLTIQGIATLLNNRRLILIASDNQSVDILNEEQQKQLQKHIHWEVANYWYKKRLEALLTRKIPGLMPSFTQMGKNVLFPIRWFWQLMRWEQTGQVAIAINLFGESSLVRYYPPLLAPNLTALTPPQISQKPNLLLEQLVQVTENSLLTLSQTVSSLVTKSSEAISKPSSHSPTSPHSDQWRITLLIQAAVEYFLVQSQKTSLPQTLPTTVKTISREMIQSFGDRLQRWLSSSLERNKENPFEIAAIIRAAIDYYFNQHPEQNYLKNSKNSVNYQLSGQSWLNSNPSLPSTQSQVSEDPWLSWEDLSPFHPLAQNRQDTSPTPPSEPAQLQNATPTPTTPGKSLPQNLKQKLSQVKAPHSIQKRPTSLQALTTSPTVPPISKIEEKQQAIVQTQKPVPSQTYSDPATEWPDSIETQATPTGYVKHPLERILEWLDLIILWVEEFIIAIWNWVKSKIQQKKRNKLRNRRK